MSQLTGFRCQPSTPRDAELIGHGEELSVVWAKWLTPHNVRRGECEIDETVMPGSCTVRGTIDILADSGQVNLHAWTTI